MRCAWGAGGFADLGMRERRAGMICRFKVCVRGVRGVFADLRSAWKACGENLQIQDVRGRHARRICRFRSVRGKRAGRICRFKVRVGGMRGGFADLRCGWEARGEDLQI